MNEETGQQILATLREQTELARRWQLRQFSVVGLFVIAFAIFAYTSLHPVARGQQGTQLTWKTVDCAMENRDYQKALEVAQKICESNPNYYYPHQYLGHIHLARGEPKEAAAEYNRAYELFPSKRNEEDVEAMRKLLEKWHSGTQMK